MSKKQGLVWVFFSYYWIIFGIGTYLGQFVPLEWRQPISVGLFVIVMMSFFIRGFNKSGLIISHIFSLLIGVLSYGLFTSFMSDFGVETFYNIIVMVVIIFSVFGIIGYFFLKDIRHFGKYLFIGLIILIIGIVLNFFLNMSWLSFTITIFSILLYLFYTLYDFNRMKHGNYNARTMGFSLFINLLLLIRRFLTLYRKVKS